MIAFAIYYNGCHVLTAGMKQDVSVLYSVLENTGGILDHCVRGTDYETKEIVEWSVPQARVGDEITVKIIETDRVSPEERRYPRKLRGQETERTEGTSN